MHLQCYRLNHLLISEHKISFIHFQTTLFNFAIDAGNLLGSCISVNLSGLVYIFTDKHWAAWLSVYSALLITKLLHTWRLNYMALNKLSYLALDKLSYWALTELSFVALDELSYWALI